MSTAELKKRLDWKEVERGYITVATEKAKTQQRRLVPISENLKLWLRCDKSRGQFVLIPIRNRRLTERDGEWFGRKTVFAIHLTSLETVEPRTQQVDFDRSPKFGSTSAERLPGE